MPRLLDQFASRSSPNGNGIDGQRAALEIGTHALRGGLVGAAVGATAPWHEPVRCQNARVPEVTAAVVIGLDVGGTKTNATVLRDDGLFLVDDMVELPSRVRDGPAGAIAAIDEAMELVLGATATRREWVRAIGLDTPGPASADGVI